MGRWSFAVLMAGAFWAMPGPSARGDEARKTGDWGWSTAAPEDAGMSSKALESAWADLKERHTTALLVVRHDRIVFERYASGYDRHKPHYTASMAKALVGGLGLMVAMGDGLIRPDDLASKYVSSWRDRSKHRTITVRHLATHTSGIEDAEDGATPHARLTGWKGDFWKRLPPPRDPFTLARDAAPVREPPGTRERYSNPGMAMLGYCITSSLRGAVDADLRSLLQRRIMGPLGVPNAEWSVGYGAKTIVDGLPLVATWGGGAYSPNAVARVGRLLLRQGDWEGRRLLPAATIATALKPSGMPGHSGLGWWVNRGHDRTRLWKSAPDDAFGGAGAGHQFLLVVPSLDLIVVRNGDRLDPKREFHDALDRSIVGPVLRAISAQRSARRSARRLAPCPPSPVIENVRWSPVDTIVRQARGSDTWPITWADDGALYTAFGDGRGFEPFAPEKLSLGFARITGPATSFRGVNVRSTTGERRGDGAAGEKASGLLSVGGTLYLWARNAGNARLVWSSDHARTWSWCDWKFEASFGCPTFLNFGKNNSKARDDYVYIVSTDGPGAYEAADGMVLARVHRARIRERSAYRFFRGRPNDGAPRWTKDIAKRALVFQHPGGCCRSSLSYNAGLKRYLWCQTLPGDARYRGGFGVYDAPEPWGPWTTAYFTEEWDVGPGETCGFPTKWMSADGKTAYLVFSGDDGFSVRKASFSTTGPRENVDLKPGRARLLPSRIGRTGPSGASPSQIPFF